MSKKEKSADDVRDAKKNARSAAKGKAKVIAKKAVDKALLEVASKLPAGQAKSFLLITSKIQAENAKIKAINAVKRGLRAELKAMKIHLRVYDHVFKMLSWEPEDIKQFEIHAALYKEQLGLELTKDQEVSNKSLKAKRAETKKTMLAATGGETGKEIGSNAGIPARADLSPDMGNEPNAAAARALAH